MAFSDESSFEVSTATTRKVWCSPESARPVRQTLRHPIKVVVWVIITYQGAGTLHIVKGSMNKTVFDVLQTRVKQEMEQCFPAGGGIFQQDKAPANTAKILQTVSPGRQH